MGGLGAGRDVVGGIQLRVIRVLVYDSVGGGGHGECVHFE